MSRPLNFRQIEAFRAVMLTGTTTAAAAMLHTTQPSISRLLAQIQSATQLKLFDMQQGRLRPTPEARQLFDTVQRHFLGLERIEQNVEAMRKSGTGILRVGCTPALGLGIMPVVIHAFSLRYPDVHINLQTIGAHHLREGLLHGLYDLILTTTPVAHPQLDARTLHHSNVVCVVHPSHPLAQRTVIDVGDLAGQMLLTLNADDDINLQFQRAMESRGISASSTVETTYSVTICMMAVEGAGIGIVNPYVASVFERDLRILPLKPHIPIQACMAFSGQTAPSAIADAFANQVEAHFRNIPSEVSASRR